GDTNCTPFGDGAPGDDAAACTVSDHFTSGIWGGSPKNCSGLNDQCNVGTCSAGSGICGVQPRETGTECSDSNPCTSTDRCTGGSRSGQPRACSTCTTD